MDNQQASGNENTKQEAGRVKENPTRHNRVGLSENQKPDESIGFEAEDVDSALSQGPHKRCSSGGIEKKSQENLLGQGGYGTSGTSGTNSGGKQGYGSGMGQAGSQNGSTGYNAGSQGMPQKLNEQKPKGSRSDNAGSNKGTNDNLLRDSH